MQGHNINIYNIIKIYNNNNKINSFGASYERLSTTTKHNMIRQGRNYNININNKNNNNININNNYNNKRASIQYNWVVPSL